MIWDFGWKNVEKLLFCFWRLVEFIVKCYLYCIDGYCRYVLVIRLDRFEIWLCSCCSVVVFSVLVGLVVILVVICSMVWFSGEYLLCCVVLGSCLICVSM